jgi:hypothetical protein
MLVMLIIARNVALGAFVGALGVFHATLLQLLTRQTRNALLARRGQPGVRDVVFVPLWQLGGIVGGIASGVTAVLSQSWRWAAIAGAAFPGLIAMTAILIVATGYGSTKPSA